MTAGKWPLLLLESLESSQAGGGERGHQNWLHKKEKPDTRSEHIENQESGHWGKTDTH